MQTPRFDHIGQFMIEEKIGEGGMGIVYRAHDPSLQRTVAIKRVHPRLKDHEDVRENFLAEARAIAAVNHPNIGQIHAIHDEDELPYLVMEFLPGPSFEELLQKRKKLPVAEVLKVAISATLALKEARNQGIIHRDVKPSNLILDGLDNIKLVDFGLAGAIGESSEDQTEVIGTPQYCSPEQVQSLTTDERSDIYSLGATLFHLLSGKPPYERESRMDLLIAHVNAAVPNLAEESPSLDSQFADLIQRMLAKNPDDRPENHEALLTDLEAISKRIDPVQRQSSRRRLIISAVGIVALAFFGWAPFAAVLWPSLQQDKIRVSEAFGELLNEEKSFDQLAFDFNSNDMERFFRSDVAENSRGQRNRIAPLVREGQLRWANDPRTVRFPYLSRIDRWEIEGLRILGKPDVELQVAGDPDQPGNRWRIGMSVGKSSIPQIEVLQHGSPVPIEIEDLQRNGILREGVDHNLILSRLEPNDRTRDRFRLSIQSSGSNSPLMSMTFQIPAAAVPNGAPGLRLEGDLTGWNAKIDGVRIQGALNRERILRSWQLAGSP